MDPGHTALVSVSVSPFSDDSLTFAVSIIINLDLGSGEAGVSMKFTVVEVGLAITAAHRPLVRFALLQQSGRRGLCSHGGHTHSPSHLVRG